MSFGGAVMLLGERLSPAGGRSVLFMLALLEVGAVALVLAVVLLADAAGSLSFAFFRWRHRRCRARCGSLSGFCW